MLNIMQSLPLPFPPIFIRIYTLRELLFCLFGTSALEFHSRTRILQRYDQRRVHSSEMLGKKGRDLGGKAILARVGQIESGKGCCV